MRLMTIVSTDNHGIDTDTYVHKILVPDGISDKDIMNNIKSAALEFCQTPEGRKLYEDNCNSFNIGDFFDSVPLNIMANHKIYLPEQRDCIAIDFNEQLVDGIGMTVDL